MTSAPVLNIRGLSVSLGRNGPLVLQQVDLHVAPGELLGVVGESGAGKSVTGAAISGLLTPPLVQVAGEIWFEGQRIDTLGSSEMRRLRGAGIGMVFQDPLAALNPVFTIGRQLTQTISIHHTLNRADVQRRAISLLSEVGIPAPEERLSSYPHELSGGMRQRVVIAMALAGNPRLIIADEPTTALDVSIQAQILALLRELTRRLGVAILLITHDMGVIAEAADRVIVLYAGRVAEDGPAVEVLTRPRHPYTRGLVNSIPEIGAGLERLQQIPGAMPSVGASISGCAFHPRCEDALSVCSQTQPSPTARADGVTVACWAEAAK
jgi:peptide/nickel transport system ATP-binding protein